MSLVCWPLTKPGLIFAAVRSLPCVVGEDNTLFSPTLPSAKLHIQTF